MDLHDREWKVIGSDRKRGWCRLQGSKTNERLLKMNSTPATLGDEGAPGPRGRGITKRVGKDDQTTGGGDPSGMGGG